MKCLKSSELIAFENRILSDIKQQKIEHHLQSCSSCKKRVDAYENFRRFLRRTLPHKEISDTKNCCDEFELVSFLDGGLKRRSRAELYLHLTQCELCLDKLVALESLLYELKLEGLLPAEKGIAENTSEIIADITNAVADKLKSLWDAIRLPRPAYGWVGVAVILIAVGLVLFKPEKIGKVPFVTREPEVSQYKTQFQMLVPANRSSVEARNPEFRWAGPADISSYNFLLLDSNGDIIWEKKTIENRLKLPQEIQLQPSMTYFWQVEGFFEAGGSVLSDMVSFIYKSK